MPTGENAQKLTPQAFGKVLASGERIQQHQALLNKTQHPTTYTYQLNLIFVLQLQQEYGKLND